MQLSLKQKSLFAGLMFLGIIASLSIIGISLTQKIETSLQEIKKESREESDIVIPLQLGIGDLKYYVIQVQQWLTDISATRGQDGLNDGFDMAEKNALAFRKKHRELKSLIEEGGLSDLSASLEQTRPAFEAFYEEGKKMAEAYVSGGPKVGNQMMAGFDEKAESMSKAMDQLNTTIHEYAEKHLAKLSIHIDHTAENAHDAAINIWITSLIGLAIACGLIFFMQKSSGEISKVSDTLTEVAKGWINQRIQPITRHDEIGQMQHKLNEVLDITEKFCSQAGSALEALADGNYDQQLNQSGFENIWAENIVRINHGLKSMKDKNENTKSESKKISVKISETIDHLAHSIHQLNERSGNIASLAESCSHESKRSAEQSRASSESINSMAAAVEEFSSSITEVGRHVEKSSEVSQSAVEQVVKSEQTISSLEASTLKINEVVEIIQKISAQTDLLALNATIEAASAGDAGKGFAVVAGEIKALARQTSEATEEIQDSIGEMSSSTKNVVDIMSGIREIILTVDQHGKEISKMLDEQKGAAKEISLSVSKGANSVNEVSTAIARVSEEIHETSVNTNGIQSSTEQLASINTDLEANIKSFLEKVGA